MYETFLKLSDPVGIIGVIILLIAYFGLSTERLKSNSLTYQFLNFIAAWLILFSLYFHWNTPSALIELAWIIISVIGIYRILYKKRKNN
jgi:hypothetical protein